MKILISSMSVQNFQNYIRSFFFAKYLVKAGHQVTLFTASPKNNWKKFEIGILEGVKVIVIPDIVSWRLRRGGLSPVNFLFRLFYLLIHKFDIYHGDGHRPAVLGPILIARMLYKKPFISEWMDIFSKGGIHDSRNRFEQLFIGPYDRYFEKKARTWADGTIVLSQSLFNKVEDLRVKSEKILLLHGGADVDGIKPLTTVECRNQLKIPPDKFIIGIVGINKDDLPDLEILFSALEIIDTNILKQILIITSGSLSNFDDIMEKRAMKNLFMHFGWLPVNNYNQFICAANIMIMPMQDNERNRNKWPNKLGDFFAAGRPVITNPVGDVASYIIEKRTGFLVNHQSEKIKNVMNYCVQNRQEIEKMGKVVRSLAEKNMSWQSRTSKLLDFYDKLIRN